MSHRRLRLWDVLCDLTEVDEVELRLADSLELLGDCGRAPLQLRLEPVVDGPADEEVLGNRHGVLQHPVNRDHVEADKAGPIANPLLRDLAGMGNEPQPERPDPCARFARAQRVRRDLLLLLVECPVHRERRFGDHRLGSLLGLERTKERRVALDLDQLELRSGFDRGLEQPAGDLFRTGEAEPGEGA
jgi:hypothetical protein